jgi:beta-glucanase (GH16 family)
MRNAPRRRGWTVAVVALLIIFAGGIVLVSGARRGGVKHPTSRHSPEVVATPTDSPSPSPSATPAVTATARPSPSRGTGPSGEAIPTGDLPGWKMVFSDDFKGRALDTRAWGAYSGAPGGDPGGFWDPSHVVVHDGVLELQTYQDPAFGNRWVSGGLSSARALKQTYGKYLVRFRMDPGFGIAGIMLLWPSNNLWPPEIDFAEDGGGLRTQTNATLHYGATDSQIARTVTGDFTTWHTVGIEWTHGNLAYTLDGSVWATLASPLVPSQPMEMDIQTQAGTCGQVDTPCPDATTPAHVNLQVDWVVAYRPA